MIINSLSFLIIKAIIIILCFITPVILSSTLEKKDLTNKQRNIRFNLMIVAFLLIFVVVFSCFNTGWSWCPLYSHYFAF